MNVKQVTTLLGALQKGSKLANSGAWKDVAIKTNLVSFLAAVVSAAAAFGFGVPIPPGTIETVAALIVGGLGLYNTYVHTATSNSVGLSPKPPPADVGGSRAGPFDQH